MTLTKEEMLQYCIKCTENFYNGNNPYNIKECWNLPKAKLVVKKQVGMNDVPPWTHQPVIKVLSCCRISGYILVDPKDTR